MTTNHAIVCGVWGLLLGSTALGLPLISCGGVASRDGGASTSCPGALPQGGTSCAGNSDCSYARCQSTGQPDQRAQCVNGVWIVTDEGACTNGCPATFPTDGAACSLPSSTVCKYPQACCTDNQASCIGGHWQAQQVFCGAPKPEQCPAEPPKQGESCAPSDPCSGVAQSCNYGDCGGFPYKTAYCDGSVWQVQTNACILPCEQLSACECFKRSDCVPKSDGCLCPCDFQCPGEPLCQCGCGGGTFLGCAPLDSG